MVPLMHRHPPSQKARREGNGGNSPKQTKNILIKYLIKIFPTRAKREAGSDGSAQHVVDLDLPRVDSTYLGIASRGVLGIHHQLQVKDLAFKVKSLPGDCSGECCNL